MTIGRCCRKLEKVAKQMSLCRHTISVEHLTVERFPNGILQCTPSRTTLPPSFVNTNAVSFTNRNVIGAIDGSQVRTPSPGDRIAVAYYNYKHFCSIILLAVVDSVGMFRWFVSRPPGSCGDSGVLQSTPFYDKIINDQARPAHTREVLADGACMLGNSAFAEIPWLRTPIPAPQTRSERLYNYKHSSMRYRLEDAFGS